MNNDSVEYFFYILNHWKNVNYQLLKVMFTFSSFRRGNKRWNESPSKKVLTAPCPAENGVNIAQAADLASACSINLHTSDAVTLVNEQSSQTGAEVSRLITTINTLNCCHVDFY